MPSETTFYHQPQPQPHLQQYFASSADNVHQHKPLGMASSLVNLHPAEFEPRRSLNSSPARHARGPLQNIGSNVSSYAPRYVICANIKSK